LSEAQLASIGYWLSGIGLVALRNSFYMPLAGDILKIIPIPYNQYPVPDTGYPPIEFHSIGVLHYSTIHGKLGMHIPHRELYFIPILNGL